MHGYFYDVEADKLQKLKFIKHPFATLLGESLKNSSGRSNKTNAEIWIETLISAGISGLIGKACETLSYKAAKPIAEWIYF